MELIFFPFERVIEINTQILTTEPGMKGAVNIPTLQGALARIDNAIAYNGLDDVFEIAAKYTASIAQGHALPDANKRTGLAVGLEYLSLNDYEITLDNDLIADAVRETLIYSKTQLLPPDKSRPPERCRDEKSNKSAPP